MHQSIKQSIIAIGLIMIATSPVWAEEMPMDQQMMRHGMMTGMNMHQPETMGNTKDGRTSIHLPPAMRVNHLAMMRGHLKALDDIIAYLAAGNFDAASQTAHSKLGLTPAMKKMCNMFENDTYRKLGLAFHQSADDLGDALKRGNIPHALKALHRTMDNCVRCHATFRQ